MRHKAPVGHGKRGPTPGSPLEGDRGRPRAARRQRSTRGPGRVHRSQPGCRASPNKPEAGKTARRTPRVAKPGGHTGLPPAHARPPYTAGSGEDEDQVRLRRQARTRPRDWRTSRFSVGMCTGSSGPRVALPRPRPNLDGGPGGRNRPAGGLPGAAAGQAASYRPWGPAARPGASRYQVMHNHHCTSSSHPSTRRAK